MYAMSWERDTRNDKYESIQHGYSVIDNYDEDELTKELSLDELMEDGFDVGFDEMELE